MAAHDTGAAWRKESMSSTDSYRPLQDGLRAAGRYLDENALRLIGLLVIDAGIVVTLAASDIHKPFFYKLRILSRCQGHFCSF